MELQRLDPSDPRPAFECGDADLDEFYRVDSIEGGKELVCVTYVLLDDTDSVVAFFSVSNDAIKKEDVPTSAFKRITKLLPFNKRYSSMPAVKIGRLGTASTMQGSGYGTMVLDFIKVWFTKGNKTGCRFIVVDAYNQELVTKFYLKNGFRFLTGIDESEETRIMFFDLRMFREPDK